MIWIGLQVKRKKNVYVTRAALSLLAILRLGKFSHKCFCCTNIIQCTVNWYVRKIIDHYCSVVPEKIPTLGSTVKWETRQASFPTVTVGPWVGTFLSPLNINDGFYLSYRCYLTQAAT